MERNHQQLLPSVTTTSLALELCGGPAALLVVCVSIALMLHGGNRFIFFSTTSDYTHRHTKKDIIKVKEAGNQQLGCVKLKA